MNPTASESDRQEGRPILTPEIVGALSKQVPQRAFRVWVYLWARAGFQTAKTWPKRKTIAEHLGMNETAVSHAIKPLKATGWLTVEPKPDNIINMYTLTVPKMTDTELTPPPDDGHRIDTSQDTVLSPSRCQNGAPKNSTKEQYQQPLRAARAAFTPPTLDEVKAYCQERGNTIDPQQFVDYYMANGWRVGRNAMKDWRAGVRYWERNGFDRRRGSDDKPARPRLDVHAIMVQKAKEKGEVYE